MHTVNKAQMMKVLRRTHLYLGLFMAPWILLYAVSGFIFNHPSWFSYGQRQPEVPTVKLTHWVDSDQPNASVLAHRIVEELNGSDSSNGPYRLLTAPPAELSSPVLSARIQGHGEPIDLRYEVQTGYAFLNPTRLTSLGPSTFLTRLHTTRTYPNAESEGQGGGIAIRTLRAMFVDVMAVLMAFWALSGLTMWLVQLKGLRRSGYGFLAASVIVTTIVWWGMYRYYIGVK